MNNKIEWYVNKFKQKMSGSSKETALNWVYGIKGLDKKSKEEIIKQIQMDIKESMDKNKLNEYETSEQKDPINHVFGFGQWWTSSDAKEHLDNILADDTISQEEINGFEKAIVAYDKTGIPQVSDFYIKEQKLRETIKKILEKKTKKSNNIKEGNNKSINEAIFITDKMKVKKLLDAGEPKVQYSSNLYFTKDDNIYRAHSGGFVVYKSKIFNDVINFVSNEKNDIKNLTEDIDPDFLDKVETRKEEDIIEKLTEIILQLREIQKSLLKFRPKLIDELAKATDVIEVIQNKLSSEEMINESKLYNLIKETIKEIKK